MKHLIVDQEVGGSIPPSCTISHNRFNRLRSKLELQTLMGRRYLSLYLRVPVNR